MKKLLGITAATMLLALTGCGGADDVKPSDQTTSSSTTTDSTTPTESTESTDSAASSDYCDALKNAKTNLSTLNTSQMSEKIYGQLTDELRKVAAVAPSDVKDDWDVVLGSLTKLHNLLDSAGISLDDLAGLSAGQVPPGIDAKQLQKLGPKLEKITQDGKLEAASTAIQQSAQQTCGLTLN